MSEGGGSEASADAKRLKSIFSGLPAEAKAVLMEFAEFLAERHPVETTELAEPEPIPHPRQESVIKAIKRLSATYPMLDPSILLNETSLLMSQHILQGREARSIIDELEILFRDAYEKLRNERP